jgi:ribonuclease E
MSSPTSSSASLAAALDGLPGKPRIHELAKRSGASSREIIALLADRGVTVVSASSSVDNATAVDLLTALLGADADAAPDAPVGEGPAPEDLATAGSADVPPAVEPEAAMDPAEIPLFLPPQAPARPARRRRGRGTAVAEHSTAEPAADDQQATSTPDAQPSAEPGDTADDDAAAPGAGPDAAGDGAAETGAGRKRRRRGRRGRGRTGADEAGADEDGPDEAGPGESRTEEPNVEDGAGSAATDTSEAPGDGEPSDTDADDETTDDDAGQPSGSRRRRRRRRKVIGDDANRPDDPENTVVHVRESRAVADEVQGIKGSTRLEAKRQRRREARGSARRPQILTEAEFLARRESVDRVMAVRQRGELAQVALLEDNILVEHFVSKAGSASLIGNVYLGKVQNVLPSMEAAFVDIGRGRNAVLYAGEVNWDASGLVGKTRRIEAALSSGDTVLVQVSKDPIGHKGARLTTQISLPGRFLVYVPGGGATGISRKLPDTERKRLKSILDRIVPEGAGVIIRTAAEGVPEEELVRDVERLTGQWEDITQAAENTSSAPTLLSAEPDTLIKVVRDLFNSDINRLVVDGDDAWDAISSYVDAVAPELADRIGRYDGNGDVFTAFRIDEQIAKALERKVHLPSGGSLVIDRTEAMTVVDVNTGKYTGSGGNLEETVTRNNLEAAEEIVRQLRLRDIGGIIVVDFIDMVLEGNRDLVLRRLTECLSRDRTRHQVAEVTSLGLVQMTRKRMGTGLVEAFSEPCPHCGGRGILLHDVPRDTGTPDSTGPGSGSGDGEGRSGRNRRNRGKRAEPEQPAVRIASVLSGSKPDPRGPRPPGSRNGDAEPVAGEVAADVAEELTEEVLAADETVGLSTDQPAEDVRAEATAAVAAVIAAEDAEITRDAEVQPPADAVNEAPSQPRSRRRRAAGRPAGAPSTTSTAVDIVLPAAPEPAAGPSPASEPAPATEPPATEPSAATEPTADPEPATDGAPVKGTRRRPSRSRKPADRSTETAASTGTAPVAQPDPATTAPAAASPDQPARAPRRRRAATRPAGPAGEPVAVPATTAMGPSTSTSR